MRIQQMIEEIRNRPDAGRIGMILSHVGLVRDSSRDGRQVSELTVIVDHARLQALIEKEKQASGIVDIRVEIEEGRPLTVGDEIMRLVVAGDIRENVIAVLERTLTAIKTEATRKTEIYV